MPPVHCEVWAGFIFINLAEDPVPLRTFLGDGPARAWRTYPFHLMTQRYGFSTRIKGNWKLAVDSVCEWYHPPYVHGRFIDPDVAKAEKMVPPVDAYHYELFRPHMLTSVPGPPPLPPREPGTAGRPARTSAGSTSCSAQGFSAPTTCPTSEPPAVFLNRGEIASWGNDQFWLFPNISIQIWARGLLHHLHLLAGDGRLAHLRDRHVLRAAGQRARSGWRRSWWWTARSSSRCRTSTPSRPPTPR